MATAERILTDEMIEEIKKYFPRYPNRQAVTLPALHVVNQHLRHIPLAAVVEVAKLLELAPAEVQDTLTFYGFFKQEAPHGKTRAWICRSISCHLLGADELLDYTCEKAGIKPGQTTDDETLTLEYGECLGACEHAPCMLAGDDLHTCITKESIDEFLKANGTATESKE